MRSGVALANDGRKRWAAGSDEPYGYAWEVLGRRVLAAGTDGSEVLDLDGMMRHRVEQPEVTCARVSQNADWSQVFTSRNQWVQTVDPEEVMGRTALA